MITSLCCDAKVLGEDFCSDCKEHCEVYDDEYTYEAVAEQEGLSEEQTRRFAHYMHIRWPTSEDVKCRVGYAQEWAGRFKAGVEYAASDHHGQAILKGM